LMKMSHVHLTIRYTQTLLFVHFLTFSSVKTWGSDH
jgi:hypothetical protein